MKILVLLFQLSVFCFALQAQEKTFSLTDSDVEEGDVFITDLNFEFNSCKVEPVNYSLLDSVIVFLNTHENISLEVSYHRDNRMSEMYQFTSREYTACRAKSIRKYLLENGVADTRLSAKGYGAHKLLISDKEIEKMTTNEEKEKAHARNRRAEFKIVSIDSQD